MGIALVLGLSHPWVLAGIIPLLLLLWWWRRRRQLRPRNLTTFLLVQRAQRRLGVGKELPPKPSFKWWLQLLPVLLLGFALAGPHWQQEARAPKGVILLDDSPSMGIGDRRARGLAKALALPGMADADVQKSAPKATDSSGLLARAESAAARGQVVTVVSDVAPPVDLAPGVSWLAMGAGEANVGIVAAGFDASGQRLLMRVAGTKTLRGSGTLHLFARYSPFSSAASPKELWMQSLSAEELPWRLVLPLTPLSPSELGSAVSLELKLVWEGDASSFDNSVKFERQESQSVVAVLRSEATALRRALAAIPQCRVVVGDTALPSAALVVEGANSGPGFSLRVAPRLAADSGFRLAQKRTRIGVPLTTPPLVNPLPRPLSLPAVWELAASPANMQTLVSIQGAPLIVQSGNEIVLLQDPEDESWSNDPSFPLLLAEMLVQLGITSNQSWQPSAQDQSTLQSPLSLSESVGPFATARVLASRETASDGPQPSTRGVAETAPKLSLVPFVVALALCLFLWNEWSAFRSNQPSVRGRG